MRLTSTTCSGAIVALALSVGLATAQVSEETVQFISEKKGEPDKAIESYETCLKLDPKYEKAIIDLTRLKEKK